jgi:hypothetical protein
MIGRIWRYRVPAAGAAAMARTATQEPATTGRHEQNQDEASSAFAPLTTESIAAQTDAGSFSRGRGYARSHRIFDAFRRENTLHARCHGSSGGPYIVEVTLATAGQRVKHNPVAFACDCPRGGFCKHIVALLLTWIERPESFDVRPPLAELLSDKSREELIALIGAMMAAEPDLEAMLELPVSTAGAPGDETVDEFAIRRQVAAALKDDGGYSRRGWYDRYDRYDRYGYDDYYAGERIAGKLQGLISLTEAHAAAGQWRGALQVGAAIAEELAPQLLSFQDENGDLAMLLSRCDAVLAAALDAQAELAGEQRLSASERTRLIDALFLIWKTSIDGGGLNLGEVGPEAIGRGATADEQQVIGERLRAAMHVEHGNPPEQWKKRETIWFISLLGGAAGLSDEELLEEYRNAELWDDAAAMLAGMGRVDEAMGLAARHLTASELIAFADTIITTGDARRTEQAIALVDDRLWEREGQTARDDQVLGAWLEERYAAHGQPEKALARARGRFKTAPSRATYDAVKAAALLPGLPGDPWLDIRPELLAVLRKRGDWYGLIDIHLAEDEVEEALKALKKTEKSTRTGHYGNDGFGWLVSPETYETRVAEAVEQEFPDEAIRIYQRLAEQRITARGRPSYQVAAGYLARVSKLMEGCNRADAWPPLISDIRQRYKTLRALREELDALGLA